MSHQVHYILFYNISKPQGYLTDTGGWRQNVLYVGSTQVHFIMCTLEIPQKLQHKFLLLTFSYLLLLSLSSNYELFMYFSCSFFHSCGSFNSVNLTSLSFSEFLVLFLPISSLSQLIESHFALSSARCHF